MCRVVFASLALVGAMWMTATVLLAGETPPTKAPAAQEVVTSGSLVIIGGSERFDHREYWDNIVELAGGPGSRIAVFPTANGDPVRTGGLVISALFTNAPPLGQALAGGLEILRTADLRASLASIVQPTLVIHGAQDAVTPCDAGCALARLLPRATLHVMQGTGHAPFLSDGDGVAALIHAFCTDEKVDHE